MDSERYHLPLPKKTLDRFVRLLFAPIERGQSLILLFESRAGRRALSKFLIGNPALFADQIKKGYENYKFFFIDPPEMTEQTPLGYMLLLYQELLPDAAPVTGTYFEVFTKVKTAITQLVKERELIFFLNQFDELTFMDKSLADNLKALWQIDKTRIHFVFLAYDSLSQPELVKQFGQLSEALMENEVKVPSLSDEDMNYIIERQGNTLGYEFSEKQCEAIKKIAIGNPYLIKTACRLLSQTNELEDPEKLLSSHYQIQLIREEQSDSPLTVDSTTGIIMQGQKPAKLKLTGKENDLLTMFLNHINEILSREQIAEVLWGKKVHEKYSDWAIDQAIHELRDKLEVLGKKKLLETIRDKGYRYKQE